MKIKKLAAVTLNKVFKNQTYTVKHGLAKGLKRRGGLAFLPAVMTAAPERVEEEDFLLNLKLDGQTIFDVGGDQGIYTLFFASRVGEKGKVVTFEPNPESHRRIVTNVELNQFRNVDVRHLGLGAKKGKLTFVFPAGEPARGSADAGIQAQILQEKDAQTIEIDINSLDSEIREAGLPEPDLVKIDVEGLEIDVLRGMTETLAKRRPNLFIEVHGADAQSKDDNARQVVKFLLDAGYKVFHVETKQNITRANIETARQGHIYCEPQKSSDR
jgi:FkbM family methyltransferase